MAKKQASNQENTKIVPSSLPKTSKTTDMEEKSQQLKSQNQQIESGNEQLKSKTQQLESGNEQLKPQNQQIESDNEQLKSKNQQLEAKNQQFKSHIEQLTSQNSQLETKIQQLIDENNNLKGKISQNSKSSSTSDEISLLKSFLFSLKEKVIDIQFLNFDDYEEESEIGSGATSSVKIVIKKSHEKFAKKELKEFDPKTFQRFLMEAEILFKLRHPCIIRIYGVNYGDDHHPPSIFLSLEPNSLENAINNKILSDAQKNRITIEIVLGMRYIHRRSFMHRDLKPLNILLSKNFHVRISDFGLAKEEDVSVSQSKGVGTLRFMAPEIFVENDDGITYTNKVDVYSFGITLIFIVSGTYPKFNLRNAMLGVAPMLPDSMVKWVRELIIKCLSLEPDERPSFEEIFEIMKENNYDMFNEKSSNLTRKQQQMKNEIEKRVLKIEAFEYQHRDD